MPNPVYPTTLNQDFLLGSSIEFQSNTITSATGVGPPKLRRRYTTVFDKITTPVKYTSAELVIFRTFFNTTLLNGSLKFDWKDPDTGTLKTYQFMNPPAFTASGNKIWSGTLTLTEVTT